MAENRSNWVGGCVTVAIVIIAALIVVTEVLPRFTGVTDGHYREAEVKQNCHAIQLALERYAVDHDGHYPLFVMGGDWTDSYVVTRDWVDAQPEIDPTAIDKYYGGNGEWKLAPEGMGDALVMDAYMPSYPGNPFVKNAAPSILPVIQHHDAAGRIHERYIGGRMSDRMVEIFGPQYLSRSQAVAGDLYVHHVFNNPPYRISDIRKETTKKGPVDWTKPSGNSLLVGNFSYYPQPEDNKLPWLIERAEASPEVRPVLGYTLAGYGSVRYPGMDVYNRNGNYSGRYRTEGCDTDCSANPLFNNDIPCICPGESAEPSPLLNNGGSDTLPDGVIVCLYAGVDKRGGRVSYPSTQDAESEDSTAADQKDTE